MKKAKKNRGIESLKSRYGLIFVAPWILGMIIFFVTPLIQSILFSFSTVEVVPGGIETEFVGLANYRNILVSDPKYTGWLKESVIPFFYSLPIILLLSMVLAIMLNQKFRGRLFFRSLYFLPVIIATGMVIELLFMTTQSSLTDVGVSDSFSAGMINVSDIVSSLGLGTQVAKYINLVISKIFDLIWNCGIQIVLFLAGLQSVPTVLYEASKVEGATKWEEFWFITFPSLSRVTLLVTVFTMIELITNERAVLIDAVYQNMRGAIYDLTSAMIWFYFLICGAIMGVLVLAYNRLLMKHWE